MKTKIKIVLTMFIAALLLSFVFAPASHAALNAVGPANAVDGFPTWYQDANGLTLGQCLDTNGNCIVLADDFYDGINPIVFPLNYPGEAFYWIADTLFGPFRYRAALEAAFATANPIGAPVAGQQSVFARIRVRGHVPAVGLYTFTHPYGTNTFNVTALTPAGAPEINFTEDVPLGIPLDFAGALGGSIGPFLLPSATSGGAPLPFIVDAATGARYIANPAQFVLVTGGPISNSVSVVGPASNDSTPLFNLAGKVMGLAASPATVTFPVQKPGVVTAATITITNPLTAAATMGAGVFSGANLADFAIAADTCTTGPIAPSGTCAITVNFSEAAPGLFGTKSAVISFPVTTPLNMPPLIVNLAGSIDNQPPDVVSTTPVNNATNVPANNAITATFSETVTGISTTTFTLTSGGSPVTGAVTYNAASNTAVFTPAANLTVGGNFTATLVAAGITDLAGNALLADTVINFAATVPDTTPPAVVSTTPANNALVVPTSAVITIKFNEPVDPATVNESTITVKTPAGSVAGVVTYDTLTLTATFKPSQALAGNQLHTVTVTTGVKSLGGVAMSAAFTATFVTNAQPTTPVLISPSAGQTGVGTTVDFQWIKSTDSDAGDTVTYKLFYCTNQFMVNCSPVTVAQSASPRAALAGLGGYGAGVLLAGVFIAGGVKSRRRLFLFLAALLISGMVTTACKSSDSGPAGPVGPGGQVVDPATLVTKNISGLTPATTYYWKVVADDGHGGLAESETTSFKTQ